MSFAPPSRRIAACGGVLVAVLFLTGSRPAAAQIDVGVRGGVYTDASDAFLGGEILGRIGTTEWFYNPNLEVVFVDDGDLITANADVHYDLQVDAPVYVWGGGGLALIFRDGPGRRNDSETDLGLNLLAGVGFNRGGAVRPYVQAKAILADDSEVAIALGVRF